MRRYATPPVLFLGGLFLAACGGAEQEGMDMGEDDTADMATSTSETLECYIARGTMAEAQDRPSPLSQVEFSVGGNDALLCYGAPSARGRDMVGGQDPYGSPWRVGANEPTTIHLSGPATVGEIALEPGSYSIYAIPNEDEWEIFVNSSWERWGIPIDDSVRASELGSFMVTPETLDEHVETMQFGFEPGSEGSGELVMEWETTRVAIPVGPGM